MDQSRQEYLWWDILRLIEANYFFRRSLLQKDLEPSWYLSIFEVTYSEAEHGSR